MITLGNKKLCSSCFSPIKREPCKICGFSENNYVPEDMVLPCGSILMGKFIIGKVLGRGGFGITYLAYDAKFSKIIAIKEYFPIELAIRKKGQTNLMVRDKKCLELFKVGVMKFYNEAKFIANFSNEPSIVRIYQFFFENNTAYLTMEYLRGMTLKDYVINYGVINDGQALYIAEEVASALSRIHLQNVLHRDVCPDNIMLCSNGSVKLLDFGSARQVFPEGSQLLSVILKPGFAPIEQYTSKGKQGEWTDIYSLAASMYYGMTKRIPENPQNRIEDDSEMINNIYHIRPDLWEVIYKAMMLKYTDRYLTTKEFCNALANIPVKRQFVKVPDKLIYNKNSDNSDNPLRQILSILFRG